MLDAVKIGPMIWKEALPLNNIMVTLKTRIQNAFTQTLSCSLGSDEVRRQRGAKMKVKESVSYKCNELTVLAPLSRVISYVRSQRSCKNNSKDLAVITERET